MSSSEYDVGAFMYMFSFILMLMTPWSPLSKSAVSQLHTVMMH